jgi:hypothetical protein
MFFYFFLQGTEPNSLSLTVRSESEHEPIYVQTTQVLLAIKRLVEAVQQAASVRYLRLVRDVGFELRQLLALVDSLMPDLPEWSHREVEMAHKVLGSDMSGLVRAMHQALGSQLSTLAAESRKSMCQAAHTIIVDSKTLLDTVNSVRSRAALMLSEQSLATKSDHQFSNADSQSN